MPPAPHSPATIRRTVAAAIKLKLAPAKWTESTAPYVLFPTTDAQGRVASSSFAVGLTGTVFGEGRQRPGEGAVATTTVNVKFTRPIRATSQVADWDAALDQEVELVRALRTLDGNPNLALRIVEVVSRLSAGEGTVYLGEVKAEITHLYPIPVE